MPPFNKIVSKKHVTNIIKDGKTVAVSAATETLAWKRDDVMAQKVGETLRDSLGSWDGKLPEGTEEVCSRETEHKSERDKHDHITAVCLNTKGLAKTVHIPVKRS